MRGTRGHSLRRFGALVFAASVILLALPTSAFAQIDVGQTVDGVGDKVDEAVDETTDKVDETVDSAEETVDGAAGSEGGVVDQTTDTVGRVTGETGRALDQTTDEATDVAGDAAKGRLTPLDEPVKNAVGRVGGIVDSIIGGPDDARDRNRARTEGTTRSRKTSATANDVAGAGAGRGLGATVVDRDATSTRLTSDQTAATAGRSPLERLIQNIGDILPTVAFPIVLLALVGAFLVLQGRVDKSDPKLALAPIDLDQEYLSFR